MTETDYVTAQQVEDSYVNFLQEHSAGHHRQFLKRRTDNPHAARAEAVVFSWLRSDGFGPKPFEDLSTGGADFKCFRPGAQEFMLEVTSLDPEAVATRTQTPVEVTDGISGGFYDDDIRKLKSVVSCKADQLKDYPTPRVLAITSSDHLSGVQLGRQSAKALLGFKYLTSEPNFQNSVFTMRGANGDITPRLRSVSAVLLISLSTNPIEMVGFLHPDPVRPLDPRTFPDVPFVRITNWPLSPDREVEIEWTLGRPEQKQVCNSLVPLSA
jgi:hypothetical protein